MVLGIHTGDFRVLSAHHMWTVPKRTISWTSEMLALPGMESVNGTIILIAIIIIIVVITVTIFFLLDK